MGLFIPFKKFLKESEIKEESTKDSKTLFSEIIKFLKDGGYIDKDDNIGEWVLTENVSEAKGVEDLVDLTTLLELLNRNLPPDLFEEICVSCNLDEGETISESNETEGGEPISDAVDSELDAQISEELEKVQAELGDVNAEQEMVEDEEEELAGKKEDLETEEEVSEDLGLDTEDIDEKQEDVEEDYQEIEKKEESLEEEEDELEEQEDMLQDEELEQEKLNEARYARLKKFVKEANSKRTSEVDSLKEKITQRRNELLESRRRKLQKERLFESLKKKRNNN